MRAPRLATTVELALASLSWSGARQARKAMESEGGSDPSEDVAKLFAVTESLVGAGIAPSIHQGRGIIISALSKSTVRATIETSDDEEDFSFEIVKEELWRAVRLLEEHGCGSEVPSAATSLDSKALRMKMAGMFLTTEMPPTGRASTSSGVVPSARSRASSSSPAAALSAPPRSGTPATSESRAVVVAEGVKPSPSRVATPRVASTVEREARREEAAERDDRSAHARGPSEVAGRPIDGGERARVGRRTHEEEAVRIVTELRAQMNAVHRKWRAYALALERATYFARVRVISRGGRVRYSDAGPVDPPRAAAGAAPCVPAPAPRGPRVAAAPPRGAATLASCMARGTAVRGAPAASRASPAEVVDLDDLEGDYDEEEDGGAADGASSDASVKSEHDEEDESEALLKDLRAAAGGGGVTAASSRDKVSDDPVFLLKAFVPPQMTVKATTTVVKFMFEHVRETLEATGARVAPLGGEDVRKSLQLASVMLVRLAGFLSQAPGELVGAAAMRAGTPMPCKTSVQGGTALKALREIVFEHMTEREVGHAATMGAAGRKSALSSSGILMQKLGVPSARLQMFHVADGGASDKGGPEGLGQGIFERGLCAISNDAAAREQLGVLVGLLEEGLSDSGVTRKGAKKMTPGCLFVRAVAGLVGNALAKSSSSSTMWAHVFLAEQCGKPSASSRERMQHNPGYEHLDTVWQAVCSVRAGVEQVLQQEWRRLMRRESLDTTELANACWYGRWRKFDLKKAITSEQTSSWLGVVKGDNHSLSSVWAIFTSFFSALTYLMTTLTHFWDPEVAFTLQLITTSAVGALEAGVPAAQIIEMLPSVVFARFDDAHREFRQLGRALPALTQTWENFTESEPHERFREVVMARTRGKDSGSAADVYAALKALEKKFEEAQAAGGKGGGGKAKGSFVEKAVVDRFIADHPGMCWVHHLKGTCTKKDCPHTHGERIQFGAANHD